MKNAVTPFLVGVVTIVAAVCGLYVLIEAVLYVPNGGETTVAAAQVQVLATSAEHPAVSVAPVTATAVPAISHDHPTHLSIPSMSVSATVDSVGETAGGAIGTPGNLRDVAWFTGSVVPGKQGSAIIDGHVNNGLGLPGVFNNLDTIPLGARISVKMSDGTTLHFVVTSIDAYPYDNVPMLQLLADTGPATLRLITCEGQWLGSQKTYTERLVVTASLE